MDLAGNHVSPSGLFYGLASGLESFHPFGIIFGWARGFELLHHKSCIGKGN